MSRRQPLPRLADVPEYKANTERFSDWLAETAWWGGFEDIPKKPCQGPYRIKLRDYMRVARFVRDIEPTPDVPSWLPTCLGLAICLRKRHQQEVRSGPDEAHRNVIALLEAVGQTLLPIYSEDQKDEYLAIVSSKPEATDGDSNSNNQEANDPSPPETEIPDLSRLSVTQQPDDQQEEQQDNQPDGQWQVVEKKKHRKTRRSKRGGKKHTASTTQSGDSEKPQMAANTLTYASVVSGSLSTPLL